MLLKFIAFFAFSFAIFSHIDINKLNTPTHNINFIWVTFPILITSFGFRHIIPTLRSYVHSNKKALKQAVIIGSLIPLAIYILWVASTLGTIPMYGINSFQEILSSGNITAGIVSSYHSNIVGKFAYTFEMVAVTTSFLGVTLGLYDFNRDSYNLAKNKHAHKLTAFIITFVPPLLFAVFYPDGFRMVLGYASIFVAVLLIGLSAAMAWAFATNIRPIH